jgi:3-hydroxyisobutyrate dehydrogenase-like beta-hydroxyacid dehydrogenase
METAPQARASEAGSWLVVGHGSVGSFVANRLVERGDRVLVFDPAPRLPVLHGERIDNPAEVSCRYVVSCVSPEAADDVPGLVAAALDPDGIFFDWNTVSPVVKRIVRTEVAATTIDVALLDSLDADVSRPTLAISGVDAAAAARLLEDRGFRVFRVGDEVGAAATLKFLRSVFMKGLEALVLEYASLAARVDGEPIVRESLESNLGSQFARFMDLLVTTNRIHAERRSQELAGALAVFADGGEPRLMTAAIEVLHLAAEAWDDEDAPPIGASPHDLADHLHETLWREAAST